MRIAGLLALSLVACTGGDTDIPDDADRDADGFVASEDCDDTDPSENPSVTWYADADGDGYGDASSSQVCERAAVSDVLDATDCDDTEAANNPSVTWYADVDGDGFGDDAVSQACEPPSVGGATQAGDCDDEDANEYPGVLWYPDTDGDELGDGFAPASACERVSSTDVRNGDDCDDTDASVGDDIVWYADADGDSFGDPASASACVPGDITDVLNAEDCDDTTALYRPGVFFYEDADDDGWGIATSFVECAPSGDYTASLVGDCDDTRPTTNPAAVELRGNTRDEDCDGEVLPFIDAQVYALVSPARNGALQVAVLDVSGGVLVTQRPAVTLPIASEAVSTNALVALDDNTLVALGEAGEAVVIPLDVNGYVDAAGISAIVEMDTGTVGLEPSPTGDAVYAYGASRAGFIHRYEPDTRQGLVLDGSYAAPASLRDLYFVPGASRLLGVNMFTPAAIHSWTVGTDGGLSAGQSVEVPNAGRPSKVVGSADNTHFVRTLDNGVVSFDYDVRASPPIAFGSAGLVLEFGGGLAYMPGTDDVLVTSEGTDLLLLEPSFFGSIAQTDTYVLGASARDITQVLGAAYVGTSDASVHRVEVASGFVNDDVVQLTTNGAVPALVALPR